MGITTKFERIFPDGAALGELRDMLEDLSDFDDETRVFVHTDKDHLVRRFVAEQDGHVYEGGGR